jgi:hypothetical protein
MPQTIREQYRSLVFEWLGTKGEAWGLRVVGSGVRYTVDRFWWDADERNVSVRFMHDDAQGQTAYRIERVPAGPDGMDMKLTLDADPTHGGQTYTYYSRAEWHMQHVTVDSVVQHMPPLLGP